MHLLYMVKDFKEVGGHLVCPNCGSRDVEVCCGIFVDRYVCKKCGFESHN